MILGAIGLDKVNIDWLRQVRRICPVLVVVQNPVNMDFSKYANHSFVSGKVFGIGLARRLSMILTSPLDPTVIVTNGDGQYHYRSILKFAQRTSKDEEECFDRAAYESYSMDQYWSGSC